MFYIFENLNNLPKETLERNKTNILKSFSVRIDLNASADELRINFNLLSKSFIAYLLVSHFVPKNTYSLLVMLLLDSCTRHIIVYERGPFLFPFDFHKVYMVMIPFPICEK